MHQLSVDESDRIKLKDNCQAIALSVLVIAWLGFAMILFRVIFKVKEKTYDILLGIFIGMFTVVAIGCIAHLIYLFCTKKDEQSGWYG